MDTCSVSLRARATGPSLRLQVTLDNLVIYNQELTEQFIDIRHEFDDSCEQAHLLEIEMFGKQPEHTVLNDNDEIISDRIIELEAISLDDIELGQVFLDAAKYYHDFNGSQPAVEDSFYGVMGCNGKIKLEFHSPVYLWLLENM
jgi:hypothetical protein